MKFTKHCNISPDNFAYADYQQGDDDDNTILTIAVADDELIFNEPEAKRLYEFLKKVFE